VLAHQLAGFDGHVEVTADVYIDGFLEGRHISVENVAKLGIGCGVVDQNVEAAELFADLREHELFADLREPRLDLLHLANMAGDWSRFSASGDDCVGYCLAAFDLAAGYDDMSALLREQLGDGFADTSAGPGNESDLAV